MTRSETKGDDVGARSARRERMAGRLVNWTNAEICNQKTRGRIARAFFVAAKASTRRSGGGLVAPRSVAWGLNL